MPVCAQTSRANGLLTYLDATPCYTFAPGNPLRSVLRHKFLRLFARQIVAIVANHNYPKLVIKQVEEEGVGQKEQNQTNIYNQGVQQGGVDPPRNEWNG